MTNISRTLADQIIGVLNLVCKPIILSLNTIDLFHHLLKSTIFVFNIHLKGVKEALILL
jgi:hypothetical protein